MAVAIEPATTRTLTAVASRMRADDWREIACQYETIDVPGLVARCMAGEPWVAELDDDPVAAFGVQPIAASVLLIWAFGTDRMPRVVPALSRFILGPRLRGWVAAGYTRVEARSIADHEQAHRWMCALGGEAVPCRAYGRGGEDFLMFAWAPLSEVRAYGY